MRIVSLDELAVEGAGWRESEQPPAPSTFDAKPKCRCPNGGKPFELEGQMVTAKNAGCRVHARLIPILACERKNPLTKLFSR